MMTTCFYLLGLTCCFSSILPGAGLMLLPAAVFIGLAIFDTVTNDDDEDDESV